MKKYIFLLALFFSAETTAVVQKGTSPFTPITPTRPIQTTPQKQPPPSQKPQSNFKPREEKKASSDKTEAIPGVLIYKEGKWLQSDYLGHVSPNIGINVEVLSPDADKGFIAESILEDRITELFKQEGINTSPLVLRDSPPLPFLNVLVMVNKGEGNIYSVYVGARLFENARLIRENFEPAGSWQVITWENQTIETARKDQLASKIKGAVEEVVSTFLKRFQEYNPKPV